MGGKRVPVISIPVVVEDADSYNCYWRMPFRRSIRAEIVNESSKPLSLLYYNVDWIQLKKLDRDTPYFYAQHRQEYPVGTPYFDQWGIVGGHTSAYRWHLSDPWVFRKSIRVTLEHWGWISPDENAKGETHSWNERQDDYSSVAFWYQTGTPTFEARAPHARERVLPNLDVVVPARDFTDAAHHGIGDAVVQDNLSFFPQGQLLYHPDAQEGAWVEIPFTVTAKEPRRLLLRGTRADDYGVYQPYLNGVSIGGPIDLYHPSVSEWEWHLLDFWPDPGQYTLRLECVGKNPASRGYLLGVESARLRERRPRVKEWARDAGKDWRTEQILYQ